ncbi:MAG TPA: alpha/beta fold hydrolase [Rhodanobacter sp.]
MTHPYRFAFLLTALLAAPVVSAKDTAAVPCAVHSTALLDAMVRGDYLHARTDFNAKVGAALSAEKLQQVWTQIQQQAGLYQKHDAPETQTVGDQQAIITRLAFANLPLNAVVRCDSDGKISTFRLVPAAATEVAKAVVQSNGLRELPLPVASPLGPLPGTLTLPAGNGPFPAVLLVAGSGPHDADETIGPNKPFRDIAQGLAAAGIASLRYDKRTYVYGARIAADTSITIDDEVTDDALSALTVLARQPHIDAGHVFVLGHSLGAMMAPRIGQRAPQLAGLILLAAPARPLLDVSAEQVRELGRGKGEASEQIAAGEKAIDAERKLLSAADPRHPPAGTFAGALQSYWLSLHQYDQLAVARNLAIPMLIAQGGSDFQVSPANDFARWKQELGGTSRVVFRLYPGLSHLFIPAGKTHSVADYNAPGHVDGAVIGDIASWIKAQPAKR